jgi:DNA-directed RNA polymerase specialized sigma subunit
METAFWTALTQSKMGKVSFEDAFGNAQQGIVEAFRTMDWERPVLFKTHATKRALAQARNAFYKYASTVRVPMEIQQQYNAAMAGQDEKQPLFKKVALDAPTGTKSNKYDEFGDTQTTSSTALDIPDVEDLDNDSLQKLEKLFKALENQATTPKKKEDAKRAKDVMYHLFGVGGSDELEPKAIAKKLNITPEQIYNIRKKVMDILPQL